MKLGYFFLITCLGLFHFGARAQTSVSGTLTQDTHWTLAGSPYTLTGTVGIINGITLTVDAGVQVNGNYDLLIKGTLSINGTTGSHVSIQSTRVIFKNTNLSLSAINYVDFNQGGVQLADESEGNQDSPKNSGTLTVNNCIFSSNGYARTKGYDTGAKLVLNTCSFNNSTIIGNYVRTEPIEINNSTLNNTTITGEPYNHGIKITNSTVSNSQFYLGCCSANLNISGSQINNCSISEGNGQPVDGLLNIDSSTITNTTINLPSARFSITNCNISTNQNSSPLMKLGNGVAKSSTITGTNAQTLFQITGYAGYNIGGIVDLENVTFNQFNVGLEIDNFSTITLTSCNFINANQYTVKNLSSKNINAQQNYWGTTDAPAIQNQIFDLYDNINYGIVDYSNFLQSPVVTNPVTAPTNLFKGLTNNNAVLLRWTAPNDPKAIGYNIYKKTGASTYVKVGDAGVGSYTTNALSLQDEIVVTSYTSLADGVNDVLEGNESQYSSAAAHFFQTTLSSHSICSKDTLKVSLTRNYNFASDEYFMLELAGANGIFTPSFLLDSLHGSATLLKWVIPDSIKSTKKYRLRVFTREAIFTPVDSINAVPPPHGSFDFVIQKCPVGSASFTYTKDQNASASWNYGGGTRSNTNVDNPFVVTWSSSGQKTVTLTLTSSGCSSQVTKKVAINIPPALATPTICEVTVDSATSKNRIYWSYPKANTLKFGIYRETEITDKFSLIGNATPQNQNSFTDVMSTPEQQPFRYRLSAFDSCGAETALSAPHRTIHLQISLGGPNKWNLDWSSYEGFAVTSYKIYRGASIDHQSLVAAVAGDINSYTDLNPLTGDAYYQIRIIGPSCSITGGKSNAAFNRITGLESSLLSSISLYPNPVKDLLVIQSTSENDEKNFIITDILGQQVHAGALYSESSVAMDNLKSGIYFVKVQSGSQSVIKKIIKE